MPLHTVGHTLSLRYRGCAVKTSANSIHTNYQNWFETTLSNECQFWSRKDEMKKSVKKRKKNGTLCKVVLIRCNCKALRRKMTMRSWRLVEYHC